MRHFTCDSCGRPVASCEHFLASIEVRPAFDPNQLTEGDLDADHLQEVAAMIENIEATGVEPEDELESRVFQFDLCQQCRNRFVSDPLGREVPRWLNFSNN